MWFNEKETFQPFARSMQTGERVLFCDMNGYFFHAHSFSYSFFLKTNFQSSCEFVLHQRIKVLVNKLWNIEQMLKLRKKVFNIFQEIRDSSLLLFKFWDHIHNVQKSSLRSEIWWKKNDNICFNLLHSSFLKIYLKKTLEKTQVFQYDHWLLPTVPLRRMWWEFQSVLHLWGLSEHVRSDWDRFECTIQVIIHVQVSL